MLINIYTFLIIWNLCIKNVYIFLFQKIGKKIIFIFAHMNIEKIKNLHNNNIIGNNTVVVARRDIKIGIKYKWAQRCSTEEIFNIP